MLENSQQIMANTWLVIVHVAGRVDCYLARRFRAIFYWVLLGLGGIAAELGGRKFWQPCVFIDAQHVFHQGTHWLGFVHRIHSLSDDRNTGKHTEPIGIRQNLVARRDLAFFELDRFGT